MASPRERADIEHAMDVVQGEVEDIIAKSIARGLRTLDQISPVWTGWYQANHRLSIGDPNVAIQPSERGDIDDLNVLMGLGKLKEENLVSREITKLRSGWLGKTIFIANAVPYAGIIEELGTTQQPAGSFYERAAQVITENVRLRGQ